MRIPTPKVPGVHRDISGRQLAHLLEQYGYTITRQAGSHLRLTTLQNGEHPKSQFLIIKIYAWAR